ncbi:MAG: hypothetical protein WBO17_05530, partial [Sphingorhabdus sp.]
ALLWILRKTAGSVKAALVGLGFLGAFVIIRAASFHHVDAFLGRNLLGARWNWILELGAIITIASACIIYVQSAKRIKRQRHRRV